MPKPARFGYTAAICCQEGALFPSEAPSGMHEARKLPRMAARERIAREYCHGRPPMNALRRNLAAVGRWGRQLAQRVRKAASRSGSTRKANSQGGSTRKARLHARFARRLDAHGKFARWDSPGSSRGSTARRLRTSGSRAGLEGRLDAQGQQGTKKRRSEERRLPRKTTGANQIRPES